MDVLKAILVLLRAFILVPHCHRHREPGTTTAAGRLPPIRQTPEGTERWIERCPLSAAPAVTRWTILLELVSMTRRLATNLARTTTEIPDSDLPWSLESVMLMQGSSLPRRRESLWANADGVFGRDRGSLLIGWLLRCLSLTLVPVFSYRQAPVLFVAEAHLGLRLWLSGFGLRLQPLIDNPGPLGQTQG